MTQVAVKELFTAFWKLKQDTCFIPHLSKFCCNCRFPSIRFNRSFYNDVSPRNYLEFFKNYIQLGKNKPNLFQFDIYRTCSNARFDLRTGIFNKKTGFLIQSARNYSSEAPTFTLENEFYMSFLEHLLKEYGEINMTLLSCDDKDRGRLLARLQELGPTVETVVRLKEKYEEKEQLENLQLGLEIEDEGLKKLAEEDKNECLQTIADMETQLVNLIVGDEKTDSCDIILELNAGVGGQEAMLFTANMYNMYKSFSAFNGWQFYDVNIEVAELGGLRKAIASISGPNVYKMLKFEGGVHRVQRVPQTEKAGRVHTSTMTVAVLPQPSEIEVMINPKDLEIQTMRASGAGGQHVNKTDSAVRIIHIPTGIRAECQQDRSQIQNKKIAMQLIRSRLYEKQLTEQMSQYRAQRKIQVGSAARSEKVRTYNYPQDRITDHRLSENYHNIEEFMRGQEGLRNMIHDLHLMIKYDRLKEMLENFKKDKKA
ncbi:hypothetical protein CHS0354_031808 [Potamilus streckersoni]|uniref:Prokaryotic-type class I peptide chain release factors domain-containing protein n=1 Tax=Potamilus streckersoni TaxID=2493646 RepID=A0AAE0VLP9_9BIVA|nr:hypothetical protein CHS0354_031808 [Potamilus streckersoni]